MDQATETPVNQLPRIIPIKGKIESFMRFLDIQIEALYQTIDKTPIDDLWYTVLKQRIKEVEQIRAYFVQVFC